MCCRIEELDFIMEQDTEGMAMWDLSLLTSKKSGKNKGQEEMTLIAYGIPFDSCIKRIINYRISKKQSTYDLKSYFQAYNEELKKLTKYID